MDNVIASLEVMWKGMLSIFVVIAAIFIAVSIMAAVGRRKKEIPPEKPQE
jgi:hypothetical protein